MPLSRLSSSAWQPLSIANVTNFPIIITFNRRSLHDQPEPRQKAAGKANALNNYCRCRFGGTSAASSAYLPYT